jgi:hypothetical protein
MTIVDGANVGRTTTTDGNGYYSLGGLQASTFTLQAAKSGYTTLTRAVVFSADMRVDLSLTPTGGGGGGGAASPTCNGASVPSIVDCLNDQGFKPPTAKCNDGAYSCSQNRSGTCSSHNGVSCYVCPGPLC